MIRYLTLAPLALAAACGGGTTAATGPDMQRTGMANPASVYCARLGGALEVRQVEGGEAGYCHLKDGSVIEEWKLYRDTAPL